jgi:hypothetical protein
MTGGSRSQHFPPRQSQPFFAEALFRNRQCQRLEFELSVWISAAVRSIVRLSTSSLPLKSWMSAGQSQVAGPGNHRPRPADLAPAIAVVSQLPGHFPRSPRRRWRDRHGSRCSLPVSTAPGWRVPAIRAKRRPVFGPVCNSSQGGASRAPPLPGRDCLPVGGGQRLTTRIANEANQIASAIYPKLTTPIVVTPKASATYKIRGLTCEREKSERC